MPTEKNKAIEEKSKRIAYGNAEDVSNALSPEQEQEIAGKEQKIRRGQKVIDSVKTNQNAPMAYRLFGDKYFEEERQKEEERLKRREKKERARMTAGALGDTLRLIGHGAAISRGAHETPWEQNKNVATGMKNLDKYEGEYIQALRRLEDMEMKDNLIGRKAKNEAEAIEREGKRYENELERKENWREENMGITAEKYDDKLAQQEKENRRADARLKLAQDKERRYRENAIQSQIENGPETGEDGENYYTYPAESGALYKLNPADPNVQSAIGAMLNKAISDVDDNLWGGENGENFDKNQFSKLYKGMTELSTQTWPDDFGAVLSLAPEFWDEEIAKEFGIEGEMPPPEEQEEQGLGTISQPNYANPTNAYGINSLFEQERKRKTDREQEATPSEEPRQEQGGTPSEAYQEIRGNKLRNKVDAELASRASEASQEKRGNKQAVKVVKKAQREYAENPTDKTLKAAAEAALKYQESTNPNAFRGKIKAAGGYNSLLNTYMKHMRTHQSAK